MTITTQFNIDLFLLVFMRITGFVLFNPIFGRTSVPTILKAGFAMIMAFLLVPTMHGVQVTIGGPTDMIVRALLELGVGLAIGVLVNLLFSVVLMAGELIDMQMGLGMANVYDPALGVNTAIVGNFFNIILTITFLAANAHLSLIAMLGDSFKAIPPGSGFPTANSAHFLVNMASDLFSMGLRMAIPIMAVELILVVAIGMMMKAVPQINIFSFGIQIEAIVGFVMLLISVSVIAALSGRLTDYVIEKSAELIRTMVH